MPTSAPHPRSFYETEYNARASIPDHPHIFARWQGSSAAVRAAANGRYDLPYGSARDERLDYFSSGQADAPLVIFIHGGWWRSLDKADFSFIAPAFTSAGVDIALTNYTLAPAGSIEQMALQQTRALAWLYQEAATLGFDRRRMVVAGHSAGAHLAAMMMTTRWPQVAPGLPTNLVKAGFLLSGLYDLAPIEHADFVNGDLGLTPDRIAKLSPAYLPQSHPIPFFTAVGGLESSEFKRQNQLIAAAWQSTHTGDIALPEADHLTICDALATPEHRLCRIALALAHASA